MTRLLEDPMPVILFGIIAEAVLGIILLRTGRGVLLWAMAGVLVVTLAGVGMEWLVVTEVEQVEQSLESAAAAIEANREEDVLAWVDPSAKDTRGMVHWAMRRVKFTKVKISDLEIKVNRLTSPPTAVADLTGMVRFRDRTGQVPYEHYRGKFTLELRRESDRWMITDQTWHNDPR
jgi:hypothetical protein